MSIKPLATYMITCGHSQSCYHGKFPAKPRHGRVCKIQPRAKNEAHLPTALILSLTVSLIEDSSGCCYHKYSKAFVRIGSRYANVPHPNQLQV